jgi:hypothetical protein
VFPGASRSDYLIGIGGPVVGLLALIAGVASSDVATAMFGGVALVCGLLFAVPLARGSRTRDHDDELD